MRFYRLVYKTQAKAETRSTVLPVPAFGRSTFEFLEDKMNVFFGYSQTVILHFYHCITSVS